MAKIGMYRVPPEINPKNIHKRGALAMAVQEQYYKDPNKINLSSSPIRLILVKFSGKCSLVNSRMLLPNPPESTFSSTVTTFFTFGIHSKSSLVSKGLIVPRCMTPHSTFFSFFKKFDASIAI